MSMVRSRIVQGRILHPWKEKMFKSLTGVHCRGHVKKVGSGRTTERYTEALKIIGGGRRLEIKMCMTMHWRQ